MRKRGVGLHLLDLGGDISGNGMSKLFLTIAAAFAEAERDRIRERVTQVKADQKARGRYLGGILPFGYRRGEGGELVPVDADQEAIREMVGVTRAGAGAQGHCGRHAGERRHRSAMKACARPYARRRHDGDSALNTSRALRPKSLRRLTRIENRGNVAPAEFA